MADLIGLGSRGANFRAGWGIEGHLISVLTPSPGTGNATAPSTSIAHLNPIATPLGDGK